MRHPSIFLALACSVLGLQAVPARAGAGDPLPPDTVLEVRGKGWGHGRGMGQWGAKGMADGGAAHDEILHHYYSDVASATRGNPTIRVLVEASQDVIVTSTKPFKVKFSDNAFLEASATGFWRVTSNGSTYTIARSGRWDGGWETVTTDKRFVKFVAGDALLELVRNGGSVRRYRGSIVARWSTADGMRAINNLPIEEYLRGVVPRESPSSWPADALEAQSVAARTYAFRYRDASRAGGNTFDICATTSCQVYEGHSGRLQPGGSISFHEADRTNTAIKATDGELLTYQGDPILAEFSSSTGGYTAPGSVPYQQAVPDPGDAVSPHHSWSASIPVTAIESQWPSIGRLVRIDVTDRNGFGEWGGRVRRLELVGTNNTVGVSGDAFRGAFSWPSRGDVRSSWFTIGIVRADRVSVPTSTNLVEGTSKTIRYRYRNAGTEAWFVGGDLALHTTGGSPLRHRTWESDTVISRIDRNVTRPGANLVEPNEVAEFRLPLDASGVAPGTHTLPVRLAPISGSVVDASSLKVRIVDSWIDRAPSLLTSTSFEKGWRGWDRRLRSGDDLGDGRDGSRGLVVRGAGSRRIEQTIEFAGGTSRRFLLGAWARLTKARLVATLTIRYANGSTRRVTTDAWSGSAWSYAERDVRTWATQGLRSITVRFDLDVERGGRASLDGIRFVEEAIGNPSFEAGPVPDPGADLPGGWTMSGPAADLAPKVAGWTGYDGASSLQVSGRPEASGVAQRFLVGANAWETLTLRFAERVYGADPAAAPWTVTLTLEHPDGSETVEAVSLDLATHSWRAASIVVRTSKPVEHARLSIDQAGQTGRAYLDAFRLLVSRLADPSFEALDAWGTNALGAGDGLRASAARDGVRGLRLGGSERAFTSQRFTMRGGPSRALRIGFFDVVSGRISKSSRVEVVVAFFHTDGGQTTRRIRLADSSHPWRYAEHVVASSKRYDGVRVSVSTRGHAGNAFVDQLLVTQA